jgi:DNA adenine methylase
VNLSPIQYYGRKAKLAPWLIAEFPKHRTYVEPFGGSLSVLLAKEPSEIEVVSDKDSHLINFWLQVQKQPRLLQAICRGNYGRRYYKYARHNIAHITDPLDAARAYFSWNVQAFRNLPETTCWDWMKQSRFDGSVKNITLASPRLQSVSIRCLDYRAALPLYDSPDTFFYLDPPYLFDSRYLNSAVYWVDMGKTEQHLELLRLIKTIKGKVMLSGYPSQLYETELKGWRTKRKTVPCVHAVTNERRYREETIWMNY